MPVIILILLIEDESSFLEQPCTIIETHKFKNRGIKLILWRNINVSNVRKQ